MSFNKNILIDDIMARIDTEILSDLPADTKASTKASMRKMVTITVEEMLAHISGNGEISVTESPGGTPVDPPGVGTIS